MAEEGGCRGQGAAPPARAFRGLLAPTCRQPLAWGQEPRAVQCCHSGPRDTPGAVRGQSRGETGEAEAIPLRGCCWRAKLSTASAVDGTSFLRVSSGLCLK